MKAKIQIDNYKEMIATMEITMTVRQWMELKKVIGNEYPGWKFSGIIGELIGESQKHFEEEWDVEG